MTPPLPPCTSASGASAFRPRRHYRALIAQGILVLMVLTFLGLAGVAKSIGTFAFDIPITQAIQSVHVPAFGALMAAISWVGFMPQALIIAVAIMIWLYVGGLKRESAILALSVIGSSLLGVLVKSVIERPRPSVEMVLVAARLNSYSFPSGHVLFFTTFFGFLLFLVWVRVEHSWRRTVALAGLSALIALVGWSRIFLGQHWASDVLAAYLLGTVWLCASIFIYRWLERQKTSRNATSSGDSTP